MQYTVQHRRYWWQRWNTLWVGPADEPLFLPRVDTSGGLMYTAGRLAELVGRRDLRDGAKRIRVTGP